MAKALLHIVAARLDSKGLPELESTRSDTFRFIIPVH